MNEVSNKSNKLKLALTAVLLSLAAPFAMAAGESTQVITKMNSYSDEAVLIGIAFAVACWAIAAVALLRRK